jgi:hypothetical protein
MLEASMALSVSCACGARFDVADTFARQTVSCPDCAAAVAVPALEWRPLRTSGYAVASVVLALVGMFTVVFTVAAVVLGVVALVSIARHRDRVTGPGYAVFGIVLGVVFTGLTVLALTRDELFDAMREQINASDYDYSGPLEIVRPREGFAITRPSPRWGVAPPAGADMADEGLLVLGHPRTETLIQVMAEGVPPQQTIDRCRDEWLASLQNPERKWVVGHKNVPVHASGVAMRESRVLPPNQDVESAEVLVDFKLAGHPMTYLARIFKRRASSQVFFVTGLTLQRRFPEVEADIRKALDSFRVLK